MEGLLAFVGVSLVVIVTPGPDTALTLRNTLLGGRAAGLASGLGIATGQILWALATAAGIAALLAASEPLFVAVKLAGAAYLVLLGVQTLRAAWIGAPGPDHVGGPPGHGLPAWRAYRQGVVSNLGNPKMAAFFTSLLPQFAPGQGGAFATLLGLGVLFAAMTATWLALYAVVVGALRSVLARGRVRRAIEAVTGAVLIALGVRIATESR